MLLRLLIYLFVGVLGASPCLAQKHQSLALPLLSGRPGFGAGTFTTAALLLTFMAQTAPLVAGQGARPDENGNYRLSASQEMDYREAIQVFIGDELDSVFSGITFIPYQAREITLSNRKPGTSLQKAQSAPDHNNPARYTLNINPNFWANPKYSHLQSRDHLLLAVAHELHHVHAKPLHRPLFERLLQIIERETGKNNPFISSAVYFALESLMESDADDAAIQLFRQRTGRAAPRAVVRDMRRALDERYRPEFERHMRLLQRQGVEKIFKRWVARPPALDGKLVVDQALWERLNRDE